MKNYSVKKQWVQYRREIRELAKENLKKILIKGRFPNNNTFPPLYKLNPKYAYSSSRIEYLCPRINNSARKYVIPDEGKYKKFVSCLVNCWSSSDDKSGFSDSRSIIDLILSNKKIIPTSSSFLRNDLSKLFLDEIYRDSIYRWREFTQRYLYEDSVEHQYILSLDIKDFYQKIYVHSITWALSGDKLKCKNLVRNDRKSYKSLLCSKLEDSVMDLQDRQTNGLPIGSLGSDLIAEIIMCRVIREVEKKLKKVDFMGIRFKDDIKVLCNTQENAELVLNTFIEELDKFDLSINENKTSISSDFSSLVMQSWRKKLLSLPRISLEEKKKYTKSELMSFDDEFMGMMITVCEKIDPNDGNFWYEFERRHLKDLKRLTQQYPVGKKRIIVWLLKQMGTYSQHTGVILKIIMSLIGQRDTTYLKLVRDVGKSIAGKRNYDFIMIWLVYFVAENYLSKKYAKVFDAIFFELDKEVDVIKNTDIKNEAKNLLAYIYKNKNKFDNKTNPISSTFKLQRKYLPY